MRNRDVEVVLFSDDSGSHRIEHVATLSKRLVTDSEMGNALDAAENVLQKLEDQLKVNQDGEFMSEDAPGQTQTADTCT